MTKQANRTAQEIANSLRATSQAYHDGTVTYVQLGERNRRDWDEAAKDRALHAEVLRILREAPHAPLRRKAA